VSLFRILVLITVVCICEISCSNNGLSSKPETQSYLAPGSGITGMKILSTTIVIMDNNSKRNWSILNWNISGLDPVDKCNAIRAKIDESLCAIFYIQKTKDQCFESSSIRKFAPRCFNKFSYFPAEGASGGLFVG
jgi:hypothetical protein